MRENFHVVDVNIELFLSYILKRVLKKLINTIERSSDVLFLKTDSTRAKKQFRKNKKKLNKLLLLERVEDMNVYCIRKKAGL